jgi:hypothetical protein
MTDEELKVLRRVWATNAANARLGAPHYSGLCVVEPAEVLALIDELEKARAELATAEAKRKGTVAAIPEIVNQSNATARAVAMEEAARKVEEMDGGTVTPRMIRALAPLPPGLRVMTSDDCDQIRFAMRAARYVLDTADNAAEALRLDNALALLARLEAAK